jgi:hypothetical protein
MSEKPSRYDPIYATPPMTIGKHEWRLIVYPSNYGHGNVTEYQWRQLPMSGLPEWTQPQHWRHEQDWPSYNHNDGMYAGMPRTLKKLYERHEAEIKAALQGIPYQSPQAELFASPLPPDPDGMNFDRASRADKAISAFRDATGTDREDALTDLLADLMHWADRAGYGFREALHRARGHYEAETVGDGMGVQEPAAGRDKMTQEIDAAIAEATAQHGHPLAAPKLQADNAKLRGFIERWLSTQPGQDYKQYIDPRALAEEARHLIGIAAAGDYARTLDATARRAQQTAPGRGIDR